MRAPESPLVVGIAGPSGSGKSSLAMLLAERVPGGGVVLALDAYYRDQSGLPEDAINVDAPEALDHVLLVEQLRDLAAGRSVQLPMYDYATHARLPATRVLQPASYIIVEGLFALVWSEVRDLMTTSFFLELDHDACLTRRVARDARERGRSPESVRRIYERSVRPMYDLHVAPTRRHARHVLDATQPIDTLAARALDELVSR
jgi:uridine kinase